MKAISCNFPDLLRPSNQHYFKPPLPDIIGAEYAGEVLACGTDAAKTWKAGDRVMVLSADTNTCRWIERVTGLKLNTARKVPTPLPAVWAGWVSYPTGSPEQTVSSAPDCLDGG